MMVRELRQAEICEAIAEWCTKKTGTPFKANQVVIQVERGHPDSSYEAVVATALNDYQQGPDMSIGDMMWEAGMAEQAAAQKLPVIEVKSTSVEWPQNGVPVIVSGGVAMRKTGGKWFTGMETPLFERPLNWTPKWWAAIPNDN